MCAIIMKLHLCLDSFANIKRRLEATKKWSKHRLQATYPLFASAYLHTLQCLILVWLQHIFENITEMLRMQARALFLFLFLFLEICRDS